MAWVLLIVAGLLEVAWASVLPAAGASRPGATLAFVSLLTLSMVALARAADSIPLGTAYAVWVGIGAVGSAIVGIALHGDPVTPPRVAFLALLVLAIVGLKVTGSH